MEVKFKNYLREYCERAIKAGAICPGFRKVKKVRSRKGFLKILSKNIRYLYDQKIIELKHLEFFSENELIDVGIYISGIHDISKDAVFVGGNATIQNVWDSATIQDVRDSATARSVSRKKIYIKKGAFEIIEL